MTGLLLALGRAALRFQRWTVLPGSVWEHYQRDEVYVVRAVKATHIVCDVYPGQLWDQWANMIVGNRAVADRGAHFYAPHADRIRIPRRQACGTRDPFWETRLGNYTADPAAGQWLRWAPALDELYPCR